MKKIKNCIIHMLGGYTEEDLNEECYYARNLEVTNIKKYLELLNGTPADEWCKLVYKYICRKVEASHSNQEDR